MLLADEHLGSLMFLSKPNDFFFLLRMVFLGLFCVRISEFNIFLNSEGFFCVGFRSQNHIEYISL